MSEKDAVVQIGYVHAGQLSLGVARAVEIEAEYRKAQSREEAR